MEYPIGTYVYSKFNYKIRGTIIKIKKEDNKDIMYVIENGSLHNTLSENQLITNPNEIIDNLLDELSDLRNNYYDLKKSVNNK